MLEIEHPHGRDHLEVLFDFLVGIVPEGELVQPTVARVTDQQGAALVVDGQTGRLSEQPQAPAASSGARDQDGGEAFFGPGLADVVNQHLGCFGFHDGEDGSVAGQVHSVVG